MDSKSNRLSTSSRDVPGKMGCGSSKNAQSGEQAENVRPAQSTGATPGQDHQQPNAIGAAQQTPTNPAAKARRHPENPVVFFDIAIGGLLKKFLCLYSFTHHFCRAKHRSHTNGVIS